MDCTWISLKLNIAYFEGIYLLNVIITVGEAARSTWAKRDDDDEEKEEEEDRR